MLNFVITPRSTYRGLYPSDTVGLGCLRVSGYLLLKGKAYVRSWRFYFYFLAMWLATYSTIHFCPGVLPHPRCPTEMYNNGANRSWTKVSTAGNHNISLYNWLTSRTVFTLAPITNFHQFKEGVSFSRFPRLYLCHTKARVGFLKVFKSFIQWFYFIFWWIFLHFLQFEAIESKIYFFSVSFRYLKTGLMACLTPVFYKKNFPATGIFPSTRIFSNFITNVFMTHVYIKPMISCFQLTYL